MAGRTVSMPYLGRTSFLLEIESNEADDILCQCPISGALHFYDELTVNPEKINVLCQCPISGALHFYMV